MMPVGLDGGAHPWCRWGEMVGLIHGACRVR